MSREGGGRDHLLGQCTSGCHHNQMSSDKCKRLITVIKCTILGKYYSTIPVLYSTRNVEQNW